MSAERMREIYLEQAMNGGVAIDDGGFLPKGARRLRKQGKKGPKGIKYAFPASYFKEEHPYGVSHPRVKRGRKPAKKAAKPKSKVLLIKSAAPKENRWVEHVKAYAAKHKVSYGEALSLSRASYRKKR